MSLEEHLRTPQLAVQAASDKADACDYTARREMSKEENLFRQYICCMEKRQLVIKELRVEISSNLRKLKKYKQLSPAAIHQTIADQEQRLEKIRQDEASVLNKISQQDKVLEVAQQQRHDASLTLRRSQALHSVVSQAAVPGPAAVNQAGQLASICEEEEDPDLVHGYDP